MPEAGERVRNRISGDAFVSDMRAQALAQLAFNELAGSSPQVMRQKMFSDRANLPRGGTNASAQRQKVAQASSQTNADQHDASDQNQRNAEAQTVKPLDTNPAEGTIQRKVGFEVEVQVDLDKGRTVDKGDPKTALVDAQRGYKRAAGNIAKGQSIISRDGWKLTPDGGAGNWYVEFITEAVDETANAPRLMQIMQSLSTYVTDTFGEMDPGEFMNLPGNFVAGFDHRRNRVNLNGNIHITAGVRPEKIITMLQQLRTWNAAGNLTRINTDARADLGTATAEATQASADPAYQGLVALLGSYISGQWRYAAMVPSAIVERIRARRHGEDRVFAKLYQCVDEDDVRTFMTTGAITDANSLRLIGEHFRPGGTAAAYAGLRAMMDETAPPGAKLNVPILSRTGLGSLRSKVNIPANQYPAFIGHVLQAAGLGAANAGARLFPLGLNVPGNSARTIERNPNITISGWLNGILQGENKSFSDTTFGFENVGPATGTTFCIFSTYEKGAIMEIRALDEPLAPARWADFATAVGAAFRALNA